MKTTGNLGLKKPDGTDIVDITDLNGNMDVLDTAVKAAQDHAVDAVKHITAAERTTWNAKASTAAATTAAAGLMAAADKAKLDGVAGGANNYVHPNHTGDVTSTGDGVTAIAPGVIINADINAAAAIDAAKIGAGTVSNAEFGYLDGVTSGIQGQLNGKTNLTTTPQQTTADVTYYVRTDGNDGNTGLVNTAGGAFKTIQKAVSIIPRTVNHVVYIYLAAGTYAEEVVFFGYSGSGFITLIGATIRANAPNYKINNVVAMRNSIRVNVQGVELTASPATRNNASVAVAENPGFFEVAQCVMNDVTDANKIGVSSAGSPEVNVYGCEISNCLFAAFASYMGNLSVQESTGTANNYRFRTVTGATISQSNVTISGIDAVTDGGIIIPQSGVLNPWGDNTLALRSVSGGVRNSGSQSLISYNWINIIMPPTINNLSEYNAVTGIFTAKQVGMYRISARVHITDLAAGGTAIMRGLVNGNNALTIGLSRNSFAVPSEALVAGNAVFLMYAGDSLVFQVNSSSNSTHDTGSFDIIREA